MSNYIFKLTPNNRQVVINSSVLINGYKDVTYPIVTKDTAVLGYVQDPDTFKFVNSEPFKTDNTPYPVDMKIKLILNNASFYGVNKTISNDAIQLNVENIDLSDIDLWNVSESDSITYDTCTINKISSDKTMIGYKIIIDIYWSDNKSHISGHQDKLGNVEEFDINAFTLDISGTLKMPDSGSASPVGYTNGDINNKTTPVFSIKLNSASTPGDNNILAKFPDSFDTYEKEIATVNISATYVCPDSLRTVTSYTSGTLKQDPYPGTKMGFIKVSFTDVVPLDVWSPTIETIYAKSTKDEANVKVDKKLYTEYYAFRLKGSFTANKLQYTDIASNISLQDFNDTGIVTSVISTKKATMNKDGNSRLYYLSKSLLLPPNVNIFSAAPPIDVLPSHAPITQDELDASRAYYYNSNRFTFNGIKIDNFYTDDFQQNEPGASTTYTTSVFNKTDHENFITIANKYRGAYDVGQDGKYVYEDVLDFPKDDDQELERSSDTSVNITVSSNSVSAKGTVFAAYAKYILNDSVYKQIKGKDKDSYGYYINNTSTDLNITEYGNVGTLLKDVDGNSIYSFKVIQDELGNSIQYKHCVNSLVDSNIQIPRYGVYPVLSGYISVPFIVYNYENSSYIPVVDYNKMKDSATDIGLPKGELITHIGTSLVLNYTENYAEQLYKAIANYVAGAGASISDWGDSILSNTIKANNLQQLAAGSTIKSPLLNSGSVIQRSQTLLYGAGSNTTYKLSVKAEQSIRKYIRVNGVSLDEGSLVTEYKSSVDPGIFVISIDEEYPKDYSGIVEISGSIKGQLIITNDENEKHLSTYDNDGKQIGNEHSSSMLLRANPKLSGNVKLVVDTDYNLYLDTFKASPTLNDYKYRKYPVSDEGNYPRDIKTVFNSIPSKELFTIPSNSLKSHKVYNDFNDQYETMYEYGAETNKDSLYNENMKILAPLHIGDDVPEFFAIFKYDSKDESESFDNKYIEDIDKFKSLIKDSVVVKTYDLRTHTSIGQYLNNYQQMLTNYGQCYLQFIEQDYDKNSKAYRQGTNIWKGISVKRGILTDQSETTYFGSKILNSDIINKQETFNNFIMQGFERNNLLYPNIINLEFMFDDSQENEYSMHRYFGLYLTANEFIKYGYVLSNDNDTKNNKFVKYDINGNVFTGDVDIFNNIFTPKYDDRLFYAITNDDSDRVKSITDIDDFINVNVKNKPESNLTSLKSDKINFGENDKSFITLHFTKPLKYGEHIKIIAMNYIQKGCTYTKLNDANNSNIPYDHIVFELIASNDIRLRNADNYISPTITTNKCRYSENTYFKRVSFYSQDIDYPEVTATLEEQISRIVACIAKINSFIHVSSHNKNSIAIMSEHDEMYLQHIDVNDFSDFNYDYMLFKTINLPLTTTNKKYSDSISFMSLSDTMNYVDYYDQTHDEEHDWISGINESDKTTDDQNIWHCYVEAEDPRNIKYDSISYFNPNNKYLMHALTNQSDYFDGYYAAFSNYCFETLGWRYNTVVKFQKTSQFNHSYVVYDNIYDVFNNVKYPLVYNSDNLYDTLNVFKVNSGYLRNNIIDPDLYEVFTVKQQFIFDETVIPVITSPYDVNYSMIAAKNESLLNNNEIHLYKPLSLSVAIMGISNIIDIDTIVNRNDTIHMETNLNITVDAQTTIQVDESDPRIQHGVMYEIVSGDLYIHATSSIKIPQGNKFIVLPNNTIYAESFGITPNNVSYLYAETNVVYKVCDRQYYQDYKYDSSLPMLSTDNFHADPKDVSGTELIYPVVPTVNCNWKSNGTYYDFNNVLNTDMLKFDYETIGNFTENVYTASDFVCNQYVTNRIDNILYVNGEVTTYKECIINKTLKNPIKKFLIDNVNVKTASAYYNANIQSLEFVFYGIKFNIKLNSKLVNSYIHLNEYSGFEMFVVNDYQLTKKNELYISLEDKLMLLVNHQFYIEYAHEAESNVKILDKNKYVSYAPYSTYAAPYCIDFTSSGYLNYTLIGYKKEQQNNFHKTLMSAIDAHNLWSSLFVQYDVPVDVYTDENKNQYVQSYIETITEYNDYITMMNTVKYPLGLLNERDVICPSNMTHFDIISSDSTSLIITKADGEYNHQAQILLQEINNKINDCIKMSKSISPSETTGNLQKLNIPKYSVEFTNVASLRNVTLNEPVMYKRLEKEYSDSNPLIFDKLSKIMGGNELRVILNPNKNILDGFTNVIFPQSFYTPLQTYIEKIIALESDKERLERYCKSVDDNIDIYIISKNTETYCIHNNDGYNPLLFSLSVPTHIKYNYGWFTPNTNEMVSYDVNDELCDLLNVDLLQSNTKIKNIYPIKNYTGNKVFKDTTLTTLNENYFTVDERSLLSTTWDYGYYRLYNNESDYTDKPGYLTGIDDKSFFGSKCMVIHEPYLLLDKWQFDSNNDLYRVSIVDSPHNTGTKNTKCLEITINVSAVIYAHFINNLSFSENWNKYKESQYTGMKNYITNIMSTYYNLNSDIDVVLYAADQIKLGDINILNEKPANIDSYYVYENYSTHIEYKNNIYTLTILINETSGIDIYPTVKIYRK